MNKDLKNRTDLSDLQKEAVDKFNNIADTDFQKWVQSLSLKDRLTVWKTLQIGIYDRHIYNPIQLITSFLPKELMYVKETSQKVNHYFRFELSIGSIGCVIISYKHFLSEIPDEEIGGMTNIWCNPFEDNKACDYLIEKEITEIDFKKKLIEIYEFIVEHNIIK